MKKKTAFWDASALVPLCIYEVTSREAKSHLRRFEPVVWWGSLVEVYSAVCRLHNQEEINQTEKGRALARLNLLSLRWKEILPEDEVRSLATCLLDAYAIKAADSLQLAAALSWCGKRPSNRSFVCGDHRLCEAARKVGFSVVQFQRSRSGQP